MTDLLEVVARTDDPVDATTKLTLRTSGGAIVETVAFTVDGQAYLERRDRAGRDDHQATAMRVCVSCTAGCPVACPFCATGRMPDMVKLPAGDITAQVVTMVAALGIAEPVGVTFAGMGEPTTNLAAVVEAARNLLTRRIACTVSISSVGPPRLIDALATRCRDAGVTARLYLSLHASTDELRDKLIPWNPRFVDRTGGQALRGLAATIAAGRRFADTNGLPHGRRTVASYLLLAGVNDDLENARRLAGLLDPRHWDVQVLRFNEMPGFPFTRPDDDTAHAFSRVFTDAGYRSYVLPSSGRHSDAGCGMLAYTAAAPGGPIVAAPRVLPVTSR